MINKTLLLTGLTLLPLANSGNIQAISQANYTTSVEVKDSEVESKEACTFMYVGKDASKEGRAYVARSADTSPTGMNMNLQIFEHNHWAGQTIYGKNGFEWKMPNETYRYIACPRNPKMNKGLHWEVSGINENGVACSATLSCGTSTTAKAAEPLETKTGITEDNLTQVIAATSKTAKEGIQTIAHIIDTVGNAEENAIMVMDKDEAWYMEMYTGHQYAAVKMPSDKACTIGNEYMLDTIKPYEEVITSPNLCTLPQSKGFAQFDGEAKLENLNLFKTYAEPLNDGCHMRTWRGLNLFAKNNYPEYLEYSSTFKYPSFFKPDTKLGLDDVITFMRDRYYDILNNTDNVNFKKFNDLAKINKLRTVADETAYQVHVLTVNPDFPAETACEEWMCLSNSMYAPFVPISNGCQSLNKYYTHVTPYYGFDEESAVCVFKRLNTLAGQDHVNYGKPVQDFIKEHEAAWRVQYAEILNKIKDLDINSQKTILTNYSLQIQEEALLMSNMLFEDLLWHDINVTKSYFSKLDKKFKPFVSIEYYAYLYGWDYARNGNIITLTQKDDKLTIDMDYKWGEGNKGSITLKDGQVEKCNVQIRYNVPYLDWSVANKYMAKYGLREMDIDYYLNKQNILNIIIPICVAVPLIAAAITIPLVLTKKYKKAKRA